MPASAEDTLPRWLDGRFARLELESGVYGVRITKRVTSKQDLIENFRAILPLFKAQYERIKGKG